MLRSPACPTRRRSTPPPSPTPRSASCRYLERRNASHPNQWHCRIGLASGPVVGSVVGVQKYVYDIFGPAVNLATKLQELAEPMQISVENAVAVALRGQFEFDELGERDLHGIGRQTVWRLNASRSDKLGAKP